MSNDISNTPHETGGSWLSCYRALLNWNYEPQAASDLLAAARKDGHADDGTAEVVYYAQAGTFGLMLR